MTKMTTGRLKKTQMTKMKTWHFRFVSGVHGTLAILSFTNLIFLICQIRFVKLLLPIRFAEENAFPQTSSKNSVLSIAPGELAGYTGWARPEFTLAGYFDIIDDHIDFEIEESTLWKIHLQCRGHVKCQNSTNSWFYVRAYGPAVLTGKVNKHTDNGTYEISIDFEDPGHYTVEVVVTFSNPPLVTSFPLPPEIKETPYEGYLVKGFPLFVNILPKKTNSRKARKLENCTISQLEESSFDEGYHKARWVVTDHNRQTGHEAQGHRISLDGYRQLQNSLGIYMSYDYKQCHLMDAPSPEHNPYQCIQKPTRFILLGDSVMRLQKILFEKYTHTNRNIRITSFPLYGGYFLTQKIKGPNIYDTVLKQIQPGEDLVIIFNTGLHDIIRLCGRGFESQRATYLDNPRESCLEVYRSALREYAQTMKRIPAKVRAFQTSHAAWPKYGNIGVGWSPKREQGLPLDAGFIEAFNRVAFEVLSDEFAILDNYWVSLPRPDNREIGEDANIGMKLAHPGEEVLSFMVRIWSMWVLLNIC